ncbi:hypothetical protein ACTSKR_06110 [Chitinibacteraceae bacterium HSL-7]
MSFRSINCFANDGKLSAQELEQILAIADRDGVMDQNEIRVLRSIISKVQPSEVDDAMKAMLQKVSDKISR